MADAPGLNDKVRQAKADKLSAKSDAEFLRCFSEKAAQQSNFPAAASAAQAMIDRLPLR